MGLLAHIDVINQASVEAAGEQWCPLAKKKLRCERKRGENLPEPEARLLQQGRATKSFPLVNQDRMHTAGTPAGQSGHFPCLGQPSYVKLDRRLVRAPDSPQGAHVARGDLTLWRINPASPPHPAKPNEISLLFCTLMSQFSASLPSKQSQNQFMSKMT